MCACVPENNNDCVAEKVRVGVCVCVHLPSGLSIRRRIKIHSLICLAATNHPELVFFLVFKPGAGTSDVIGSCDCRHVCDDEETHREGLDEGDHVPDDHRSHRVLRVVCSRLPLYNLCVFSVPFGLHGVAASFLVGWYDLALVSVVRPFCRGNDINPFFISYSDKFIHHGLRVSLFVPVHLVLLVLEAALHGSSVIMLLLGIQVISCSLELLWFCRVSTTSTHLSILQR